MPNMVRVCLPLLCVALSLTACNGKDEPSAFPSAVTTLGQPTPSSAPSATASPTASPTKASPKPPSPAPVSYPTTPKTYAEAVIAAWKAKNMSKLADLATPLVSEQLMEIPGPPNMNWSFVMCDGAAGSSYCQFSNTDGHKVTLRLTNETIGKAHAVVDVTYV